MMTGSKVLIVEDEPLIAMELEDRLSAMGYAIVGTASDGEAALRLVEIGKPDIVLMDIHLRGLEDGITVAGAIGERFAVPVIFVTAHAEESTLARAKHTKPLGYLLKPFRGDDLRATIEMALHRHRVDADRRRQIIIDPLTGLYNRRFLDEVLPRECSRAQRNRTPLSVAMLDLDRFKAVNDRYGHDAGDHVLRTVAAAIRSSLRKSDLVCRYGGEELVVLLPETPLESAAYKMERLCAQSRATPVVYQGEQLPITLSAGVATVSDDTAEPADVIRAADAALYRAKQSGRDRVCAAGDAGHDSRGGGL